MNSNDTANGYCWNRIGIWRTGKEICAKLDQVVHCKNCPVFIKNARGLLHVAPPGGYRSEWTMILAAPAEAKPLNTMSAFVFRTGKQWLALPAAMILEVLSMRPIHSIPNMDNTNLRGLVNIHGRLQLCVTIGRILGLEKKQRLAREDPAGENMAPERLVVVSHAGNPLAFPVSEVKGIFGYSPEMTENPPVAVSGAGDTHILGTIHLDGIDVALLDGGALFETLTKFTP